MTRLRRHFFVSGLRDQMYKIALGKSFWEQFEMYFECERWGTAEKVKSLLFQNQCDGWADISLKSDGRFDRLSIKSGHIVQSCFIPEIQKCVQHLKVMFKDVKELEVSV